MSKITLNNYEAFLLDYSEGNLGTGDVALLKAFCLEHPELQIGLEDLELPSVSPEPVEASFKNNLFKTDTQVPGEEILDYLEGNLLPENRIAFELRLAQDKELEEELEIYKKTFLVAEQGEVANFNSSLQKTEEDLVLNNRLLAYLENQLAPAEKAELEKELRGNAELQKEFNLISTTVLSADASVVYPDKESLKKESKVIRLFGWRSMGAVAAAMLLLMGLIFVFSYYLSDKHPATNSLAGADVKKEATNKTPDTVRKSATGSPALVKETQTPSVPQQLPVEKEKGMEKINPRNSVNETQLAANKKEEQLNEQKKEETVASSGTITAPALSEKLNKEPAELAAITIKQEHIDSILSKQNYLLVAEEFEENDLDGQKVHKEKGFWKRAVQVAKQANKMGVKSVDGEEDTKNSYRLSFNSFSMGKK